MKAPNLEELVAQATHFSSHSGEVGPGGIFIALKGATQDAHDFVPALLEKGILAAIVEKNFGNHRALVVENSHKAHWQIAKLFRKKFKGTVIGVGGSSGKTSTKELLFSVLNQKFKCVKTDKSQNGLLGLPKTLEKLRPGIELAIVEIGIDAPHEMQRNVDLVCPTHALLTSIGEEHLQLLKDVEGVFREERILVDETLRAGGLAYCPSADKYLARLKKAKQIPERPELVHPHIVVKASDKHTLQNMALVSAVALDLGMDAEQISAILNTSEPPDGRGVKWSLGENKWVIRDHYNANPSSMRVSLESAVAFSGTKQLPLRLILGDMRELGDNSRQYHKEIVAFARGLAPAGILWVGPEFSSVCGELQKNEFLLSNSDCEYSDELKKFFTRDGITLVKGSRGTALEKIMDRLYGLRS